MLSDGGCTELEGVDDAVQFEGVRTACGTIGLDEDTQMQVKGGGEVRCENPNWCARRGVNAFAAAIVCTG